MSLADYLNLRLPDGHIPYRHNSVEVTGISVAPFELTQFLNDIHQAVTGERANLKARDVIRKLNLGDRAGARFDLNGTLHLGYVSIECTPQRVKGELLVGVRVNELIPDCPEGSAVPVCTTLESCAIPVDQLYLSPPLAISLYDRYQSR